MVILILFSHKKVCYNQQMDIIILLLMMIRLVRGKTLIVVAHRLNTIQNADQILVIDQGRLAACGQQEELLDTCPLYQTMWEQYQSLSLIHI